MRRYGQVRHSMDDSLVVGWHGPEEEDPLHCSALLDGRV